MAAGPDTISPLASALLSSILADSRTLSRIQSELSDATSVASSHPAHAVSWSTILRMSYFMACFKETSRLFPSIPAILPQTVSSGGLVLADGRIVPEGTAVGAAAAVINRNESVFGKDANVWNPDRWLGDNEKVKRMDHFLFTWGWGARQCIGKNMAMLQCCKLVLQVSQNYRLSMRLLGKY